MTGVRFAPSPTGRFHVGNLRTAWISHFLSRHLNVPWVLRFEDIDTPRSVPGAMEGQLNDLKELGLIPDQVLIQSQYREKHFNLFLKAVQTKKVYPCFCSRKTVNTQLNTLASAPHRPITVGQNAVEVIYTGHCRDLDTETQNELLSQSTLPSLGWRFRFEKSLGGDDHGTRDFLVARTGLIPSMAHIQDASTFTQDTHSMSQLRSSENEERAPTSRLADRTQYVPAYHWACAIDDSEGNYQLLVRAWDLAHAQPLQHAIHMWLAELQGRLPVPISVFHTSLVTQNDGHRLEKRSVRVTLEEMKKIGFTPEKLVKLFEESFSIDDFKVKNNLISGAQGSLLSFGETKKEISLHQLDLDV